MSDISYVSVMAASTRDGGIPSDADTTSGYYIRYNPMTGEDGGYTGTGWYLNYPGNPFDGFQYEKNTVDGNPVIITFKSAEEIVDYYNEKNNLNEVFRSWKDRVGDRSVSAFCDMLMSSDTAYYNGCITMP